MQTIILAAGLGRRLGNLTSHNTKCMIEVNGVKLIDRLLEQLSRHNLQRIIIVIGYEGEKLRRYILENHHLDIPIEFVENPVYDKTNNIYSLWLTKELFAEDNTLLVESDLIVDDSIFDLILNSPDKNVALVDKYASWMDGTMVRINNEQNIETFIPKKAFKYSEIDTYYKTINIYKFNREFIRQIYLPFLDAYIQSMGNNEYYEQVLRILTLIDSYNLKALPLSGEKWYEIDDIQDLHIAEALFAPAEEKLKKFQQSYGGYWRYPSVIDFCYLVNPYFPKAQMLDELKSNFEILVRNYPSGMDINSLLAAKYFGLKKEYVCVGNGAAELIKALMEHVQGKIGMTYPTFEEYPNRCTSEQIIRFQPENADFSYTVEDLMTFFADKELEMLLVVNPDNPSGNFIPQQDILRLYDWCEERNIHLVVDESFVDFAEGYPKNTLLTDKILEERTHLSVMKSISKSYGVPGLRLGILASADTAAITAVKKEVAIWNINSFAEFYMQIFGKYENDYHEACFKFIQERKRFLGNLQKISFLRVIPSQANYFLCEVTDRFSSHELTLQLLEKYNILIKDCATKKGFNGKNYIRIAIRDAADNNRLIQALTTL